MEGSQLINVDAEIFGGFPVFAGTGVPVRSLTDWLAAGHSLHGFLDSFPSVRRSQAESFLRQSERALLERPGVSAELATANPFA